MENIQNITLDIMNQKVFDYVYTKQYDVGRTAVFNITQNGEPFNIQNVVCVFELKKPDGCYIIQNLPVNSTNHTVTLVLDEQCTAVAGKLPYQLTFQHNSTHAIISTVTGYIMCDKAVAQVSDIKSASGGNLIEELLDMYDSNIFVTQKICLAANGWSNTQQTVAVAGVIPDEAHQLIIVRPTNADIVDYAEAEIMCIAQGEGTLTFKYVTAPSRDLEVYVLVQGMDSRIGNIAFTYSKVEPGKYDLNEDDVWLVDYGAEEMQITDGTDPWGQPSSVSVVTKLSTGVNIADITVDSVTYPLYAPDNTYDTLRIDDTTGDVILTNGTTWDGTHTSLKETIGNIIASMGGVSFVPLTPEAYEQLTPQQKADPDKLYFVRSAT